MTFSPISLIFNRAKSVFSRPLINLSLAMLVGLGLRLAYWQVQEFWGDEVFALSVVKHYPNFSDLLSYLQVAEVYPPLYYWLLHTWAYTWGFSNAALRSLPIIFGVASIGLTYFVAKELFNKRAAVLAAWLVAVLPLHIYYSQIIRAYVMYTTVALLALLCYLWYRRSRRWPAIVLYIIGGAVGLYFHYSFVLFIWPLAAWWLIEIFTKPRTERSREFVIWFTAQAAIAVLFSPWLPVVLYKIWGLTQYDIYGYARGELAFKRLTNVGGATLNELIWFSKTAHVNFFSIFSTWVFKLSFVVSLGWWFLYRNESARAWLVTNKKSLQLIIFLTVSSLLFYLASSVSLPYTPVPQQHVLFAAIFIVIILAAILTELPQRLSLLLVSLFLVSLFPFAWTVIDNDSLWDPNYRMGVAADFINFNYQPGDVVVIGTVTARTDFNYYLRPELETIPFYPIPFLDNDELSSRETLGIAENEFHFRLRPITQDEAFWKFQAIVDRYQPRRVWLVYFPNRPYADQWFSRMGWSKKIGSNNDLLPIDLWEKLPVAAELRNPQ